jgi:hypothetical protein
VWWACWADRVLFAESFENHEVGQAWLDGETYRGWRAEYHGYGTTQVEADPDRYLSLHPASARGRDVTHGSLATTVEEFSDIDLSARLSTDRQLRPGGPNPWEVAWLLWHYSDDEHFYSIVLKPDGWELGKEDPAYRGAQRFLQTGREPRFALGLTHEVRVRQVENRVSVWVNGALLCEFVDTERPYLRGRVGLYTEDAEVRFDDILVSRP